MHILSRLTGPFLAALGLVIFAGPLGAQTARPIVPGFWRTDKYLSKPVIPKATPVRFVTSADFPPFNYRDDSGNLTGFNIEIARAICSELQLTCEFRALRWDQLIGAVVRGRADAIVASLATTAGNRRKLSFSYRYYRTPARFVTRLENKLNGISPTILSGRKIATVKGTSHEAYLKTFFGQARIVSFETSAAAREATRTGKVDALFGDGISLMYWLSGTSSRNCCRFVGGPYTESAFFGEGVGIAVRKGNRRLIEILNYGLVAIRNRGTFEDIYLRYFPRKLY